MITASVPPRQIPASWQRELAEAITQPAELAEALGLPLEALGTAATAFPLRVPRSFVARMRRGDPHDPLLRQILPVAEEQREQPGYLADPLAEHAAQRAPALLQKYRARALLITTETCAVHCRYCFRREFPYTEQRGGGERWGEALAALAADTSIEEIILSGGDPLSLGNTRLGALAGRLAGISHLRRLRIHTRLPVVLPSRVDAGLLRLVRSSALPMIFVLHANHPAEIDTQVRAACAALREAGATLLNQTVLLAGVNDDATVLALLSQRLFEAGVLPYYLHALDPVRGAAHFAVPDERARGLAGALAARLPGYLVPRLVREIPGATAKTALTPISATA